MHTPKKLILSAAIAACFSSQPVWINPLWAAELNTNLPQPEEEILFTRTISIDLPSQPLATSLKAISAKLGINITFNDALVNVKKAPAISGTMLTKELFKKLLANNNLEAKLNQSTLYIQPATKTSKELKDEKTSLDLDKVEVRAKKFYEVGPMPGLALTKEEIPGNVQSLTAKDIKEAHTLTITDLMNQKLQSVTVNDYQSNPFQMDLQYRGFTASPQLGTAQGISVFLDGIRVNEPFGDVVNWDMIPMNALASLDMFPGSNPVFGLGTLGGALAMRTKSGFDGKTLDAEVLTGSFGRKQLQISAGNNNGVIAGFLSGNFFLEDGWRDNSPSKVNQIFGKAEWQNERARLSLSGLYAGNKLTGNGLLPQQMVDQNPKQVYTSPDESRNNLFQFQLSGIWDVTDTFNITAQVYNRNSKRKSHMSDVNENFGGTSARPNAATINDPSRQLLNGLPDINRDGLPDYNNYAMNVAADANGNPLTTSGAICTDPLDPCVNDLAYGTNFNTQANANQVQVAAGDGSGNLVWNWTYDPRRNLDDISQPSNVPGAFNAAVTNQYVQIVRNAFENYGLIVASANGAAVSSSTLHPGTGSSEYSYDIISSAPNIGALGGYTDDAGFFHDYWELVVPINSANITNQVGAVGGLSYISTMGPLAQDANGNFYYRDGKYASGPYANTGYIEGTPTAIFTDTQVDQLGKGASLQFNWNLDKHKFMIGSSVDKADTTYESKQYLGMLDAQRNAYVAPELLGWEYYANSPDRGYGLNDFKGSGLTKSLYFSETWSPTKTLNITTSARYNRTYVNNQLSVARLSSFTDVNTILNYLNAMVLCTDNNSDGTIDPNTECPTGIADQIVPFDPSTFPVDANGQNIATLRPPEKEKFKYRSFNPSLGITWQAREDLNLYANLGRGARTPTVIELGCAYDPTPLSDGRPRSLAEQRVCNLPGALSGDPYLKQVRSTSYELGARGQLTDGIEWNAALYQTDLTDDIYFVAVNATSSYFQNVGDTRRRGLEMGLKGKWGKASWGVNYALTDATFQSKLKLASPSNSSAGNVYDIVTQTGEGNYQQITVNPGDRMPGVALHNLNANVSYDITNAWRVGLNVVAHSDAFIRGNENNKHRAGPASPITGPFCDNGNTVCTIQRADFGEGKTDGYAVVNFNTTYKISPEWTFGLRINNLFDKEYASAGRLGLNAFSPSIRGVIGESGFNYNSADWQGTSFLGTGAPRSAFVTLSYEFQPKKLEGLVE
ncbi:TonB-dependent receptor domain-containing protein [Methylophilus aquaticus]|uniref:TonB-dependent receptor n=1 Tax=Methylophilus aquaticus TaxID=1971610 RepID=A0ABT9JVQ8_9PROT|nr:TonB-dependent receptor [Methylophilus aquaticus]MDP8568677.1 TonB-dependent receptor [Methylophilus aquaticus]